MKEYKFDEIESCECIGNFEDEYVYDVEIADDTHTFIGNDILVHNSLYMSYDKLLQSIIGIEDMSSRDKLDIIVGINEKFLNQHNKKYIEDYYASRYVKSIHDFELETVNLSGLWLDVKKRYCQLLLWKDGKYFDTDSLPMKVKGLEMTKSSYPKFVRESLKRVVRSILETTDNTNLWTKTNQLVQQEKIKFNQADIEDICASQGINGYTKYIIDENKFNTSKGAHSQIIDKAGTILYTAMKCPANVRALGTYNTLREAHHLKGDPIYGGKCKIYIYKDPNKTRSKAKGDPCMFAFQSHNYPSWAEEYAPIDREAMFQKYFLDPLNRICSESMGLKPFKLDGSFEIDLFGNLC